LERSQDGRFALEIGAWTQCISNAHSACAPLPEAAVYARVVDMVRDGVLIVIEVEVLEPALFMELDPPSAERFAEGTVRRLAGRP
jgi:hypothetical protein